MPATTPATAASAVVTVNLERTGTSTSPFEDEKRQTSGEARLSNVTQVWFRRSSGICGRP